MLEQELQECLKRDFPGSPVVKTLCFQQRGLRVQSLVRELRFYMPHDVEKKRERERVCKYRFTVSFQPLKNEKTE